MPERLDKIVAAQTGQTRTEAKKAIRAGQVLVNGQPVRSPEEKFDPTAAEISCAGQPIVYQKYLYLMLNKPAGVLTATSDARRQTVLDLIPACWRRPALAPVGRLDRDTTGLLLLTDDGAFAHRVISPKSGIEKTYLAEVDAPLAADLSKRFAAGLTLADGTRCLPARLEAVGTRTARITVSEGKYHQIKRMLGVCGYGVDALQRVSIGALALPDNLLPGACRPLNWEEIGKIGPIYTF